jgi:hypothetical protein
VEITKRKPTIKKNNSASKSSASENDDKLQTLPLHRTRCGQKKGGRNKENSSRVQE